ncbi:MAG: CDP-glycerol--glycerophosphate glycerophosphotransferase [Gammaproteobacteria bacterium]|nr:CDP-glycerol--glycerophosphate glycerophosphotransferase [Gammaproteobacteria bacterium]MBT6244385.1 CDP-glycerol--glycerophosphate glycerophosphotransferase [Gammaproteobacteria bacterium]
MRLKALFYIAQDYAFAILRPLQAEIIAHGGSVVWLLVGDEITPALLMPEENQLPDEKAAIAFNADAVFAPGDRVPGFIPGLKVQVFHGLNEYKRGNQYPERGLFDLYCTEGPSRTAMLEPLARKRGYFKVCETGWLKLDSLFQPQEVAEADKRLPPVRPRIAFASTFTARLSGAEALFEEIKSLIESQAWDWLITLHPKMDRNTVDKYRSLVRENVQFYGTNEVISLLHRSDVMVCDNSSILQEFLLLEKPVVTFKNREPLPCMIDIRSPAELGTAIQRALQPNDALKQAIAAYGPSVTPYLDGHSAERVFQATVSLLKSGWQDRKPRNWWRNLRMRHNFRF